jgi:hypothetical protein
MRELDGETVLPFSLQMGWMWKRERVGRERRASLPALPYSHKEKAEVWKRQDPQGPRPSPVVAILNLERGPRSPSLVLDRPVSLRSHGGMKSPAVLWLLAACGRQCRGAEPSVDPLLRLAACHGGKALGTPAQGSGSDRQEPRQLGRMKSRSV